MKVLFISGSYTPIRCGVGDYTTRLVAALQAEGTKTVVVTSVEATAAAGVLPIVPTWSWRSWAIVARAIRQEKPDVIHMQYPTTPYGRRIGVNFLGLWLWLWFRHTPRVVTIHEYQGISLLGKCRIILTTLGFTQVVAANAESGRELQRVGRPCQVIPIGSNIPIEPTSSAEATRLKRHYAQGHRYLVTNFGFIYPDKGAINAINAILAAKVDAQLVLATAYEPANPYHQQVHQLVDQNPQRITWTDYLSPADASRLLQVSDVVLLPYDHPATLRRGSLLAAISHHRPVITTGPVSPPLVNQQNCYILGTNTPAAIAEALEALLPSATLRKMLSEQAAQVAKQYSWKAIAERHLKLYEKLF